MSRHHPSNKPIVICHRIKKIMKKSSTPGKQKCPRCQAKPEHRVICKRNRSYKYDNYERVITSLTKKATL